MVPHCKSIKLMLMSARRSNSRSASGQPLQRRTADQLQTIDLLFDALLLASEHETGHRGRSSCVLHKV